MLDLKSVRDEIFSKYHTDKVIIGEKKYRKLSAKDKEKFKKVDEFDYIAKLEILPEEESTFLALKSFEAQMETRNAIITIKYIVVFIFALSIIASIMLLILQAQRF